MAEHLITDLHEYGTLCACIIKSNYFQICRTLFVGRHKTGPFVRQTWLEAIISLRNLNYIVFLKPVKLLVVHLQWGAIFYVPWCNFYFIQFGTIFYFMRVSAILRTLVRLLFYARQRNFMPKQFSSLAGFYPDRGGVEVTGQTASLLAKAAPSLQHHSSIGSWSLSMTIFLKLSPPCR